MNKFINVENNPERFKLLALSSVVGVACGLCMCISLNKLSNHTVTAACKQSINQVVQVKTVLGDSYGCVSRAVLYGPSAPLKP